MTDSLAQQLFAQLQGDPMQGLVSCCAKARAIASKSSRLPTVMPCSLTWRVTTWPSEAFIVTPDNTPIMLIVPPDSTSARSRSASDRQPVTLEGTP